MEEVGFAFGRWRLLPTSRQLLADGKPVALGSRAFDVLLALVEAQGELVSKDALLQRVWPCTFVEENNLQVQVSALRRVLGQGAERLIATIPGRGYRFTGDLPPRGPTATGPAPDAAGPDRRAENVPVSPLASGRPVLVVLPFADMTGDTGQEYFADGITEDLTTALSHLRWFRHLPQLGLHLQGPRRGRAADRARTRGRLRAPGQRPQGRRAGAHHRAAQRGRDGAACLGRALRRRPRRRLRAAGPGHRGGGLRDRAQPALRRNRAHPHQAHREPRRLRPVPALPAAPVHDAR